MGRIATLLLGICAALALGASAARAGAWQFVETSCSNFPNHTNGCVNNPIPGPGTPIILPQVIAWFSSPDQSGSYQFNGDQASPPIVSGDSNFTFQWGDPFGPVPILPPPFPASEFTIDWNGPPTFVHYFDPGFSTSIDGGSSSYEIGTDFNLIAGCGRNEQGSGCTVHGFWDPVGVPEASSVTLVGALLALLTLLRLAGVRAKGALNIEHKLVV